MNRTFKIVITIGIILSAVGIILFAICMTMLDWQFTKLDSTGPYTAETVSYNADDVMKVRLDIGNQKIRLNPSSDGNVTVKYQTSSARPVVADFTDGVLTVARKHTFHLSLGFFNMGPLADVIVSVPNGYAGALDLETSNGAILVEAPLTVSDVLLTTSNSKINLTGLTCKSLTAETSNGAVELEQVTSSGAMDLKTSNSSISVENSSAKTSYLKTSNGKIELEDSFFAEKVDCKTSNSRIDVDGLESPDISLVTSNGTVSGEIKGKESEYLIKTETSNGDNSLHDTRSGDKKLTVSTSNSSIKLSFEER